MVGRGEGADGAPWGRLCWGSRTAALLVEPVVLQASCLPGRRHLHGKLRPCRILAAAPSRPPGAAGRSMPLGVRNAMPVPSPLPVSICQGRKQAG